jgi:glycosyltransferase involved in cell wall biosynthesis
MTSAIEPTANCHAGRLSCEHDALSTAPLVTVGFPLYRSQRFLSTIQKNLDAIDYPNVEIIVSDRHVEDDALAALRSRYQSDSRFRFMEATDQLGWVENFNLILSEARGKYAVLMFHDDSYPPTYLRELVAALERRPDASLAFGRVEQISLDGFLPTLPFSPPPAREGEPASILTSIRMLTMWQLWFAFRGMVRVDLVQRRKLFIRRTYRNIRADIYWVFALSLQGALVFVPTCWCVKRFYRSSTAADWRFDLRQALDACRVLQTYLNDFARSRRDVWLARAVLVPWCLVQAVLPRGAARRLVEMYERLRLAS